MLLFFGINPGISLYNVGQYAFKIYDFTLIHDN